MKQFTITKKIAKQGMNNIIVIPACLRDRISAGSVAEIKIKILGGNE
jgi:hypothetical protein